LICRVNIVYKLQFFLHLYWG